MDINKANYLSSMEICINNIQCEKLMDHLEKNFGSIDRRIEEQSTVIDFRTWSIGVGKGKYWAVRRILTNKDLLDALSMEIDEWGKLVRKHVVYFSEPVTEKHIMLYLL